MASIAVASALSWDRIAQELAYLTWEYHPALEAQEPNEFGNTWEIARTMFAIQMHTSPKTRDAHAKGHGCASASFEVDENLAVPETGVFHAGKKFEALVRFSNGRGESSQTPDAVPDGRGIAIKLLGALPEGEENLLGMDGRSQDFLFVNANRFFIRTAGHYLQFQKSILESGSPGAFFYQRFLEQEMTALLPAIPFELRTMNCAQQGIAFQIPFQRSVKS